MPGPDTGQRVGIAPQEQPHQPSIPEPQETHNTMPASTGEKAREAPDAPEEKKPNRVASFIAKLGLDAPTLITMFK